MFVHEFACVPIGSAHNQLKTSIQHASDLNAPVVDIDINREYCAPTLLPTLTLDHNNRYLGAGVDVVS